jgi:hypothetical protein
MPPTRDRPSRDSTPAVEARETLATALDCTQSRANVGVPARQMGCPRAARDSIMGARGTGGFATCLRHHSFLFSEHSKRCLFSKVPVCKSKHAVHPSSQSHNSSQERETETDIMTTYIVEDAAAIRSAAVDAGRGKMALGWMLPKTTTSFVACSSRPFTT